jgi:hypothetical protein
VVIADEVQEPVHEGRLPGLADDLWAENGVAELSRELGLERLARVDREREHVCNLVDPEMLSLECADLVRPDEVQPELALIDALLGQHLAGKRDGRLLLDRNTTSVFDLDRHHR